MRSTLLFIVALCLAGVSSVQAQRYMTRDASIEFFSETPMEDIEAINNQVSSAIDFAKGEIVFSLLMKAFTFEKALMQEHFNEKYVESDKHPKATFKGKIENADRLELSEEPQEVSITGKLTIKGVTREITISATLAMKTPSTLSGSTTFDVAPADYNIKIPAAVRDNIAKTIRVTVKAQYDKI